MTTGERIDPRELELTEKVVYINRVSKVVKGGRRFSFSALVVVGDGRGHIGAGMGKANEVPEAIRKGASIARRALIRIPMIGTTIPHPVMARFGAARVMIKPASPGTGVIAGGGVRAVMEVAGVKDVLAKSLGSSNAINVVRATIDGLTELRNPDEERRRRAEAAAAPIETVIRHGRPPVVRMPKDREGNRRGGRDDRPRPPMGEDRPQFAPRTPFLSEPREPREAAPTAVPTPTEEALIQSGAAPELSAANETEMAVPELSASIETATAPEATAADQTDTQVVSAAGAEASAPAVEPEAATESSEAVTSERATEPDAPASSDAEVESPARPSRSRAKSAEAAETLETPEAIASSGEPEGTIAGLDAAPATGGSAAAETSAEGDEDSTAKSRRTRKSDAISSAEEQSETPTEGSV